MNLNNKFGECCKCPALNDGRMFTSYVPRKDYNNYLMHQLNVNDNNEYRVTMQSGKTKLVSKEIYNNFNNNYRCADNGSNVFYKRLDNIDKFFEDRLRAELNK